VTKKLSLFKTSCW